MKTMTISSAISLMSDATDVNDWNQKRDIVKNNINLEYYDRVIRFIDASGLCSLILEKEYKYSGNRR